MSKLPPSDAPKRPRPEERRPNKKGSLFSILFTRRKRQPNFFFSMAVTSIKIMLVLLLVVCVGGAGVVLGVARAYRETIPELEIDNIAVQNLSSFVYDRDGVLLTTYKGIENRIWATIDEIPENLKNAFVAVEDARFYTHDGVDIKRIVGAFVSNMRNDTMQGGSTITQQLVKTRLLSMEQTYKRKIQEAYIAIEMEDVYDKDQILEWYLNTIPLGGSNYGVKAAAMDYFGKELDELTLRECAALAGITRNPTKYNPRRCYYTKNNPEVFAERTDYALFCLFTNNFITQEEYIQARGTFPSLQERFEKGYLSEQTYRNAIMLELPIIETTTLNQLYEMPAAIETVLYDVASEMLLLKGLPDTTENRTAMRVEIQTGGYNIYSTIDPVVQRIAEETIYNWEKYPEMRDPNDSTKRDVSSTGIIKEIVQPQAAFALFDYKSGEYVAIVGGRTPPTGYLELNRARSSEMPVGSSIKPIAVYGPALDKGYSPASVQFNLPIPIVGWDGGLGYPRNSSNGTYMGIVTLRQGMRASLNIVAARTLMDYVGLNDSRNYLISMGISPDHIDNTPFGLSLGSSRIPMMEMAAAYGTVANTGVYQKPISFSKVTDSNGNVILDMKAEQKNNTRQVFREGTAWMLTNMLIDAVQSGTGSPAKIKGLTIGGKTGTNSDNAGVMFAGISPYYSAALWIGHDQNKRLASSAYGGSNAAPLWKEIMTRIHEEKGLEDKPIIEAEPEELGLVKATVCSASGLLATDACKLDTSFKPVTEYFHNDYVPTETCNMHMAIPVCMDTGMFAAEFCQNHTTHVAILLPEGHIAEQLTFEQLEKLLPGALLHAIGYSPMAEPNTSSTSDSAPIVLPTIEELRLNPYISPYFCYLHQQSYWNPGGDLGTPDIPIGPDETGAFG